jgi:hypothetical protein
MPYKIKQYSLKQAEKLNVNVKPSIRKNKKIDVYDKKNNYITSIGDTRYNDYPTYLEEDKEKAEERRRAYHSRHKSNNGIAGFYASRLLW